MKTSLENIAAIIAAAIWADGVYDPAEEITVEEIAEALELDEAKFKEAVNKCVRPFRESGKCCVERCSRGCG